MALEAILFDMDGVIVDTEPLHRKAYFSMFKEMGLEVSDELYATFAGATTHQVCSTLIDLFQMKTPIEAMFLSKRKHFKTLFYEDAEFDLIEGVQALIQHYFDHDIPMILASSASHTTIDMVFDKFNLSPFFKAKISGEELKASKPHPEIFERAAALANVDKKRCMVIEDSTNGIMAAHQAGIFCAAYQGKNTLNQDYSLADILVDDYAQLRVEVLEKHFKNR